MKDVWIDYKVDSTFGAKLYKMYNEILTKIASIANFIFYKCNKNAWTKGHFEVIKVVHIFK